MVTARGLVRETVGGVDSSCAPSVCSKSSFYASAPSPPMGSTFLRLRRSVLFLRTVWSILGITVVLLLLTEAGFRLAFALKDRLGNQQRPERRVLSEGYGGATWPIQHYRELELIEDRWQPYVYFRQKPFRGQTITVGPDGLAPPGSPRRRAATSPCPGAPKSSFSCWEGRHSGVLARATFSRSRRSWCARCTSEDGASNSRILRSWAM